MFLVFLVQDPFIATEVGYEPFDRGQAAGVWVTESDGVTPAESTVRDHVTPE